MRPNISIASLACIALVPLAGLEVSSARAAQPEVTWLSEIRTSTAELTTVCEGTTTESASDTQVDPLFPFEALVQTSQSCPAGNTSGSAGSLLQSQLYTYAIYGRGIAFAEGSSDLGVEASASAFTEFEFSIDETVRYFVYGNFVRNGGVPGGHMAQVTFESESETFADHVSIGDGGGYVLEYFLTEGVVDAGTYTILCNAELVQDTPVTSLPQGESEWDLFFWVSRLGDANSDGNVDFADLLDVLGAWGPCAPDIPCVADTNADGVVNFADVLDVIGNWD